MQYDVITLFPEIIDFYCSSSILGRAKKQKLLEVNTINPRDYTKDKHRKVDDTPYGGGAGMVLKCEPFFAAYESIKTIPDSTTILLTPQGKTFNQKTAEELSLKKQLILICGHYEGFDERIRTGIDLIEISIGDFVLTGGELAALSIIDATARLIPSVLGKDESSHDDTFSEGLLEYPHYTKPADFRNMLVPEVLLSGNHKEIEKWRHREAILRTYNNRPDLFKIFIEQNLSKEDKKTINELNFNKENYKGK
jgi:tRNA (guanine37-N1)-methyltransferase